jgi:hypothetical protein
MRPSPTSKLPAGTLSDASGGWCVDCDLFWSPSLSDYDEESPPPVKRPACTMHLCQRCSWSPIAQCRYSDLAVCWSCDQYLRWLEKSRAAQVFLDEFLASESGNRPNQLPSADYPNITADDVQNEPLHSTSGAVWSTSHSDEESPPPEQRPASLLLLCHRCGWRPIAQCRYSDLAVCWSCDQYLWWLEQSREAQEFLDEFLASESGNRPKQLPSADHHITTADDVHSHPRHSANGAECLSSLSGSVCSNSTHAACVCGLFNAQSCPNKENHHCLGNSPVRQQLGCATLMSEDARAIRTAQKSSKRLKTACEALHSSALC